MKEEKFRNKVTCFTFLLSLLVVWAHAYNAELFLGKTTRGEHAAAFQELFGELLGQTAVPGFFMLSAYLFYRNFDWSKLKRKWNSRIYSVLCPYILWTSIYYFGYVIGSRIPAVSRLIGKGVIPLNLSAFTDAVLHYRYLYVYWYLFQLILLILLAPVLYPLLKHFLSGFLFLLLAAVFVGLRGTFPVLNADALIYYSLGAFLALHGKLPERGFRPANLFAAALFLAAGAVSYRLTYVYYNPITMVAYRICIPFGLWLCLPENSLPQARAWMKYGFFLYTIHFAFVRLINKAAASVLPPYEWIANLLFLLMPVVLLAITCVLAAGLKKYTPGFWRVCSGGR